MKKYFFPISLIGLLSSCSDDPWPIPRDQLLQLTPESARDLHVLVTGDKARYTGDFWYTQLTTGPDIPVGDSIVTNVFLVVTVGERLLLVAATPADSATGCLRLDQEGNLVGGGVELERTVYHGRLQPLTSNEGWLRIVNSFDPYIAADFLPFVLDAKASAEEMLSARGCRE